MSSYTILSTKKLETPLIEQAKANGIDITEAEFITVKQVNTGETTAKIRSLISRKITAVFTSANAVNAIEEFYGAIPGWDIFCLSGKTREAVSRRFESLQIVDTADSATELAQKIPATVKKVVFFCGNQRRDELPSFLENNNVEVDEIVVYETTETPVTVTANYDAVMFFSPGAVKSFFAANQLSSSVICFAIGNTTAGEIRKYAGNRIIAAGSPSQEEMIAAVIRYFKQPVQS
jgi:uroporphyrinogen-III synthase